MSGGYFDVSYGNWLPKEEEAVLICECPNCGEDLYEGDVVLEFEGVYYCDAMCLANLGAVHILERDED